MKLRMASIMGIIVSAAMIVSLAGASDDDYKKKPAAAGYGKKAITAGYGGYKHDKGEGKYLPPPDGEEFWEYISEKDPYLGWGFWPGYPGLYPGRTPHGAFLKIYANSIALKAAREGKKMPFGAILVKENYGKDKKTLMALTPMYKVKGYNPDGGDWFWTKYGADGKVLAAGKPEGCINCHRARMADDWLFTEPK